jgi:hypothetical protein
MQDAFLGKYSILSCFGEDDELNRLLERSNKLIGNIKGLNLPTGQATWK